MNTNQKTRLKAKDMEWNVLKTLGLSKEQLEADGSIESYEQPGGAATAGKPRRYYRITRAGRGALEAQQTEWRRVSRAINAVLETMDIRAGVVL